MRKAYVSIAALSAALVLPMAGAMAQDNSSTAMSSSVSAMHDSVMVMDASQFRDVLYRVRELFKDMKENHRLAVASNDTLLRSKYQMSNRSMLNESISLLDTMNKDWSYGDVQRLASQGDDPSFVRLSVWDLRNMLAADQLNGRDAIITSSMWSLLEAAIKRAESPDFRVSSGGGATTIARREITWSNSGGGDVAIPHFDTGSEYTRTERTDSQKTEIPPIATRPEVTTRTETVEVTPTPEPTPTTEETVVETPRTLPRTGGDPSMLFLLGSTFVGAGSFLRRRRS